MVEITHDLEIGDHEVVKRYRSWERSEPDREWAALTLLHRCSPGLAPEPFEYRSDRGMPTLVMSRVPGVPLGASALTPAQVVAVSDAMRTMHQAVPADHLDRIPERISGPTEMVVYMREWCRQPRERGSVLVDSAFEAGTQWVQGPEATELTGPLKDRVFANGDGNLGNYMWDGERCRVVDFEDSGASDCAYEVADLVEHVSVWLAGLLDSDALVDRFGLDVVQMHRLLASRRLLALFWLLMLMPGNRGHSRNPAGSVERQAQRLHDLLARQTVG